MDIHVEDIEHYYNTNQSNSQDLNQRQIQRQIQRQSQNYNVNIHKNSVNSIEDIPENNFSENVVKQNKQVSFSPDIGPMKQSQSIPKPYAKMSRPIQPSPKQQLTYDDILSKMGMFVVNGELHLKGNGNYNPPKNTTSKMNSQQQQQQTNIQIPQNSYIYNKYFKDALNGEEEPQRPRSLLEYRDMLIKDIIQKARVKQIKSKKLIMPNSNIRVAGGPSDLNKLFKFSQR